MASFGVSLTTTGTRVLLVSGLLLLGGLAGAGNGTSHELKNSLVYMDEMRNNQKLS